jgi:hypothetical protein
MTTLTKTLQIKAAIVVVRASLPLESSSFSLCKMSDMFHEHSDYEDQVHHDEDHDWR